MAKHFMWLSYDLGLRGNYDSLYAWLDNLQARECGESVAYFQYDGGDDVAESLRKEIESHVRPDSASRIYIIYYNEEKQGYVGRFLFGNRRKSPWAGYGVPVLVDGIEDEGA